ncbi:MAG: MFS transporter [Actinomycetota bacterium]|nr:MFS transporter [Actinomycetota bacterium]
MAFMVLFPASGAFVSLSQATLMDLDPDGRERNMARWSVAGGLGAVGGPLAIAALAGWGGGWRWLFAAFALASLVLIVAVTRAWPAAKVDARRPAVGAAFRALLRPGVARWLAALEFADLMLDVLLGFLALYFVDEVGASLKAGGLAVAVWTGAGLAGGFAMIGLLRRFSGLAYLRASVPVALLLYVLLLTVPGVPAKLMIVCLLGLVTAGWYSIPKARLYAALTGQSGAVITLGSVAGAFGATAPLVVGLVAERQGLGAAMWLLLAGPVGLLLLLPRR